jgi:hypothetical protein
MQSRGCPPSFGGGIWRGICRPCAHSLLGCSRNSVFNLSLSSGLLSSTELNRIRLDLLSPYVATPVSLLTDLSIPTNQKLTFTCKACS